MPEDHIPGSSVRDHVEKLIPGWYKADQYDDIELLKPGSDDNQINVLICTWNEEVRMLDNQSKGIGGKEKGRMAKEIWANAEAKIEEISSEVDIMKRRIDKLDGEKAKLQETLGQRNEIISTLKAEVEAYRQKESKRQIKRQSGIRHSQARETNQYKKQYVSYRSDK
jgi:chromosome segregation ATPase